MLPAACLVDADDTSAVASALAAQQLGASRRNLQDVLAYAAIRRQFDRPIQHAPWIQIDMIGRYGGEEFIALLPGAQEDEAAGFAEREADRLMLDFALEAEAPVGREPVGAGVDDATLVVDPDAIVAESAGGVRALYVVLTRAAHRMTVLRPVDGGQG